MSEEIKQNNDTKKSKKYIYFIYLFAILGITALVLYFSLRGEQYKKVITMFQNIHYGYFFLFIGVILLSFLINAFVLFLFTKFYTTRYKIHQAIANNCVGVFYSGITPGTYNTGGQFAQAYTFKKQGIPLANGASILVMQYIVYQSTMLFVSIASLIYALIFNRDILSINIIPGNIFNSDNIIFPLWALLIIGFVVNMSLIVLLYFMSYSKRIQNFILINVLNLLYKLKIIKELDKRREKIKIQIENFRIELRRLQSNLRFSIFVYFFTFIYVLITFSYPYLCGLGFNLSPVILNNQNDVMMFFDFIALTNIHQVAISGIPIPGGAGISEYIFNHIFKELYDTSFIGYQGLSSSEICSSVMLLWRMCTYLLPFSICGIVAATYKSRGLHREDILYEYDRSEFSTIQIETLNERLESSNHDYEILLIEREKIFNKFKIKKKKNKNRKRKDEEDVN